MKFSVIYSFDILGKGSVSPYMPTQRHLFEQTEGDDQYQYDYLADETGNEDYRNGKHRKLCAVLTRKQFERFLSDVDLYPEDAETMGSLGAPGFGPYIVPAISFTNDDPEAVVSAYVTPIPEIEVKTGITNRPETFDRIKKAILKVFD